MPHLPHDPLSAFMPFFIVVSLASLIGTCFLHFMHLPSFSAIGIHLDRVFLLDFIVRVYKVCCREGFSDRKDNCFHYGKEISKSSGKVRFVRDTARALVKISPLSSTSRCSELSDSLKRRCCQTRVLFSLTSCLSCS